MKKILINLTSSLFTVIFSLNANAIPLKEGYQPADKAANSATKQEEKEPEDLVKDENLKKDAQFSCLKFAAMRLGNEMSLRVTPGKFLLQNDSVGQFSLESGRLSDISGIKRGG